MDGWIKIIPYDAPEKLKDVLKSWHFWKSLFFLLLILSAGFLFGIGKGIKIVEEDAAYYVFDNFINNSDFKKCMGEVEEVKYDFPYLDKNNNSIVKTWIIEQ